MVSYQHGMDSTRNVFAFITVIQLLFQHWLSVNLVISLRLVPHSWTNLLSNQEHLFQNLKSISERWTKSKSNQKTYLCKRESLHVAMYLVYIGHCPNPFADFEYNLFHVILTFFYISLMVSKCMETEVVQ